MTHILHRKKLDDVGAEYLTKITANSDVERGRLHGEIEV